MKRAFLSAAFALLAAPAFAHAMLEHASPPVGGTVSAPAEIRITFSEGVEPKFSSVALSGPAGAVALQKPTTAPGDNKTLVVKIGKTLAPGTYTVNWRAVSVDTHHTQGSFDFSIK